MGVLHESIKPGDLTTKDRLLAKGQQDLKGRPREEGLHLVSAFKKRPGLKLATADLVDVMTCRAG